MKPRRGEVVLITGGLGDIGLATAQTFRCAGACVVICDLPAKPPRSLRGIDYASVDITDDSALRQWILSTEKKWGEITVAVANAAVVKVGSALDISPEDWHETLSINLTGTYRFCQLVAQRMVKRKSAGRIVVVGSWAAHAPHPQITAYSAAKAGLRMAMQCLALEMAPHGIRVCELAPGYVEAGLSARLFAQDKELKRKSREAVPSGSLISAEEVAAEIVSLSDRARKHFVGTTSLMDGGLSLVVGRPWKREAP